MKNRTKTLLLTIGLTLITILSIIIVFVFTQNDEKEIYDMDLSDINYNFLNTNSNLYSYDLDGYITSIGIDASEHNVDLDFETLNNQGIEYVFLRLGWRGYVEPTLHIDKKFEEYYQKAKNAGLDIGVYFFSQAITSEEAIEEANFVLNNIKDKTIDTYIVYDFETIEDINARTNNLTRKERTIIATSFLEQIKNNGYKPMLYTNLDWIKHHYNLQILLDYPIWLAQYSKIPTYKGKFYIWQYSSGEILDGTSSNGIDLNLMIKKEETN